VRIGIGRKIGFGFALQVVLIVASGAVNMFQFKNAETLAHHANDVRNPLARAGWRLEVTVEAVRSSMMGELLYGSDSQALNHYHSERLKFTQEAQSQIATLQELSAKENDAELKAEVTALAAEVEHLSQLYDESEKLVARGGDSVGKAFDLEKNEAAEIAHKISEDAGRLVSEQGKLLNAERDAMSGAAKTCQIGTLVTLVLAIVFGSTIARALTGRLNESLSQTVQRASAIADGDMTGHELESLGDDEIADLTKAVNRMQANLGQIIHAVMASTDQVSSAAEEISVNAVQSARASSDQQRQAEQVKRAMEEMSLAVQAVAENSRRAVEQSEDSARRAKSGGEVVRQTVATMEQISDETERLAGQIDQLGRRSEEIGRIVGVIDEIADQTNLLALNAAIEAARAGEQGRGFAVVADEVRKLAERTAKATKEISTMIANIQSETQAAVNEMKESNKRVSGGVATANGAGKSLEEIIASAERVGEMIKEITRATEQQSQTARQVQESVGRIDSLVRENASGAQESAHACESLSGLALELQRSTSRFKVNGRTTPVEALAQLGKAHPELARATVNYRTVAL
jgi:methyl-accepting chemotaxis protein